MWRPTRCWSALPDHSACGTESRYCEQAIVRLLSSPCPCRLRFVLMGNGLLHGEMRSALAAYEKTGEVIFTGSLPSDKVAEYLDASDILVSPHIPMPDGSRFFGSPTKLFEYMAMGKGIVASRLEQLAEVLEHDRTAWLVTPGDVEELAEAILRLALDPAKREAARYGRAAGRGRAPQLGPECLLGLERHARTTRREPGCHEHRRRLNPAAMTLRSACQVPLRNRFTARR